jgi:hypothetical protein
LARKQILFNITVAGETINFVERSIGSKGRDILAIKLALGVLTNSSQIQNNSPQDFSIGKSWFDCSTGEGVSSTIGIVFDEKMKSRLMTYQIQNQFVILSYYFEKYMIRNISTKEDLLAQILNAEQIFTSELGNIGEGTLACLHGWVPSSDLKNEGFYIDSETVQQVPMYLFESIQSGAISKPERISRIFDPNPQSSEDRGVINRLKTDFSRFYRSYRDIQNKIDENVGWAIYEKPSKESELYAGARQVATELDRELAATESIKPRREIASLSLRALEPNPLTDPDPFIINNDLIGAFFRTDYTLESLPPILGPSEVAALQEASLAKILSYYSKSMVQGMAPSEVVKFIDLRTPSLRPGDVYRAYFEIDKKVLDSFEDSDTSTSPSQLAALSAEIIENKINGNISTIEESFCALGTDIEEEASRVQYQKYRAFATKKKREIVRELRSAAARAGENSDNIGDGITADLGPFGNVNLSSKQILTSALNVVASSVRTAEPEDSPTSLKIRYNDLVRQIDILKDEFRKAQPDFDSYKDNLSKPFSSQEESNNMDQIIPALTNLINDSKRMKELARERKRSISDLIRKSAVGGFLSAELEFNFSDVEAGSKLLTIVINLEEKENVRIYPLNPNRPSPPILDTPRSMHYLRNLDNLTGAGSAVGAICEDDTETQAGLGVSYVLKYTKDVSVVGDQKPDQYNPFHNPLEPASLEVQRFVEEYKDSDRSVLDSFISPTAYGISEVLPLIGPDCGDFDSLKDFVSTRQLEKYICDYISCLRLPAINIKIPNLDFKLPDIPDFPTFKWPGMSMDFLELLREIAKRLICRFVNAILDILKTPFCGDQMIDDLYGAGSNQVSPAIKKALGDALADVGIPTALYDNLSDFMDDLSKLLTPREFCALLEGSTATQEILTIIRRAASKHDLSEEFSKDEDVYKIFINLGSFLDPQFCEDLNSINDALSQYSCDSPSDVISQIRNRISRNENVTDEDINRAAALAQKNYEDKAAQLEAMLLENGLGAAFPEVLYGPGNPDALINQLPAPVLDSAQEMAETIFEAPKMSYISSLNNYIPSMFLSVPAKADVGDPNYNPIATSLVQRHSTNLSNYQFISISSEEEAEQLIGRRVIELKKLYHDYKTEESTLPNGDKIEYYVEEIRTGPDGDFSGLVTLTSETSSTVTPVIREDELFPIRLSKSFYGITSITSFEQLDRLIGANFSVPVITGPDNTPELYTAIEAANDIQTKTNERLEEINQIIQNNLDKAFGTTNKSEFLIVLKEFYNGVLERSREGTASEAIDYSDEENALILRQPAGAGFNSSVVMRDIKFEGNKLPYAVSVSDDFFLGAEKDFSYCDEIPAEYLAYEGVSGNSYPRRQLFTQLYLQNLRKKAEEYGPEDQDLTPYGLNPEQNANFQELLYTDVYALTAEGLVEQIRDYVANSRLFNNDAYLNRLERVIRGMSYYDETSGCIKNKFNLIGKSELDFDKIIAYDFMTEFQRELGRPENSALSIDPSKQGPVELAVANTVVKAYIRLCILELILKGAITLSVWDLEYIIGDEFFVDYVYEFISLEVERNGTFSENVEQFDDALFRTTGTSNKHLAMKRLINEELATFVKLSKNVYDHDPNADHSDWFANILPLVNVSDQLAEGPLYPGQFDHALDEDEIPSRVNAFSHLERYIRIEGPLANADKLVGAQYDVAQQKVSDILDKLRNTNFEGPQMPSLDDYLMDGTEEEFEPMNDQDRFRELVSPEEFRFLLEEVLYSGGRIERYLADLLNQVGPEQTPIRRLFGKPQAITRTPLRAIRRKRKIIKITDEDLMTSNNGKHFEEFFGVRNSANTDVTRALSSQLSNSTSEEDRFYIVPLDAIEAEDKQTFRSIDQTLEMDEFVSNNIRKGASFFKENFLIQPKNQRTLPEAVGSNSDIASAINESGTRGYTLSKIRTNSEDSRNPDNYHDPLDPSAPWNLQSRSADRVSRIIGQAGDQNSTEEIIFKNHYGEVEEEIWNRHLEEVDSIQEETWEETVIDLVLDASPVFDKIGESYDSIKGQEIENNSQLVLLRVMDYLDGGERRKLIQVQDNKSGPGYTFVVDPGNAGLGEFDNIPRFADNFGYKESFNYLEDTLYNTFQARKTNGSWTIGDQQILKRNDYKIPVRILITQIMDASGTVLSAFVKTLVPEILDFNDRSKDSRRSVLLSQAFSKVCTDFVDSINSTYELIRQDEDHTEEEVERLSDPINRFDFVKGKVPDFPVFCRTSDNPLPTGPSGVKNSVMSVSKLYSVASQLEATQEVGNFTNEQTDIDALFAKDRGMLVKKAGEYFIPDLTSKVESMFRPYYMSDEFRGTGARSAGNMIENLAEEVGEHIDRQRSLSYTNLHNGGLHRSDTNPVLTARTISNLITWFQQRRSDAFWGLTYNTSDSNRNLSTIAQFNKRIVDTVEFDLPSGPNVEIETSGADLSISTQIPIEEFFFRAGDSMFYADSRTYDWQLMELLDSKISSYEGTAENIEVYLQYKSSLEDLLTYITRANDKMKEFFGDNYEQNPDYQEQFIGFSNSTSPSLTQFKTFVSDMVDWHGYTVKPTEPGRTIAGGSIIPRYNYYRKSYLASGSPINDAQGVRREMISTSRLEDFSVADLLPPKPKTSENSIILDRNRAFTEFQYQNLQAIRDSRQNLTLRYNAALGPQGLDVLEDVINILASYNTTDEDGNPTTINILRGTKITQGLRLMHNLDLTKVTSPAQVEMLKYGFLAQSNVFQQEERQGLMRLPAQGAGLGSIFTSEMAAYEREIASLECWSRGESLLDVVYSMDNFMLDELKKTTEYRAYNELCFPAKKYASMMTVHSTSMLGGYNTMPSVLVSTKDIMASIFSLMTSGTDFEKLKFGNEFSNIELRNMIDDGMSSEGPDDCFSVPSLGKWYRIVSEMVEEMIKKFPSLVLRGIADQIDPAYKEIKTHWMSCQLDGFGWQGLDSGQVITPITRRSKLETGVHKSGENGTYAPVNVAFPVDLAYGIGRLIDFEPEFLGASIAKLIQYIGTGNLPLIDLSYAFQIPCKDIDVSGDNAFGDYLSRFDIGRYGRYGHPLTIFTALALSTPVLPGDRRQKEQMCELNDPRREPPNYCEDDEEPQS